MRTVYRTLVLKYDLILQPEVAEKIPAFIKVQEEFRRWTAEWVKSGGSLPLPERPLRYFAKKLLYAGKTLDWLRGMKKSGIEVKNMRPPLIFDVQLRLGEEKDISAGVFIDVPKKVVKIRKWSGKRGETIVLPLGDKAVNWILARVKEGGRLTMAAVWVGASRRSRAAKLYVALVFRREVAPMRPKRLLVVDFNALHNGVSWAVVEDRRIVTKGILRPDVSKILHLQKRVVSGLDSVCVERDEVCDVAMAAKSRIWRILKTWEDEAAKKLVQLALQYKAAIVVDVPKDKSIRVLMENSYTSEKKIFLNFGRLRRKIRGLAEWYGIFHREERLYSKICPRCNEKMEELPNRRVRCVCGFDANRDEVPAYWALRLFTTLFSNSPFSAVYMWF